MPKSRCFRRRKTCLRGRKEAQRCEKHVSVGVKWEVLTNQTAEFDKKYTKKQQCNTANRQSTKKKLTNYTQNLP